MRNSVPKLERRTKWPTGKEVVGASSLARGKGPINDGVDIPQLSLQVEGPLNLFVGNAIYNVRIVEDQLAKSLIFVPGTHRISLHDAIGVLARNALLHQVEQQLSAEHQPAG